MRFQFQCLLMSETLSKDGHIHLLSMAVLMVQRQLNSVTETIIRSKKPKLFVVWPFIEKFASVYSQGCHLLYKQNKTRKLSGKQRAHLLQLQQQTKQTVRTV